MRRLYVIAFLVTLAIVATLFMFINALIVNVLGSAAKAYVLIVGIPTVVVLLLFGLAVLTFALTDIFHFYKLKWEHREHYYEMARKHRKLQLEKHRQQIYGQQQRRIRFIEQVQRRYHRSNRLIDNDS